MEYKEVNCGQDVILLGYLELRCAWFYMGCVDLELYNYFDLNFDEIWWKILIVLGVEYNGSSSANRWSNVNIITSVIEF